MREPKAAKGKDQKRSKQEGFKLRLGVLTQRERLMFTHCVEAMPLGEMKKWIRAIARDKVVAGEQRLTPAAGSSKDGKEGGNQLKEAKDPKDQKVQSAVKQGYGASILSYISFWGGAAP